MSFPTTEKSLEVPSRYEAFENDVIGASSPQAKRSSVHNNIVASAKKQKVSDVAVAGESPNLKDVASTNSSEAFPSASTEAPPQMSPKRPVEVDLGDNSTTPSIEHLLQRPSGPVTSTQADPRKNAKEATVDLLTTESMHESPMTGYGQANALRLPSSPESESDLFLENLGKKVPRRAQQELSIRRTREWLNSLPQEPEINHAGENENSLESTNSMSASQHDSARTSVLVVAPHPRVREVRIVLQRLDPQMLLKVPIHEIQNLFTHKPYSLSFPQIQKAMNTLITSSKIGLVPFQQKPVRRLAVPTPKEKTKTANGEGVSSSFLLRGKKCKKKRKLLNLKRQPSTISEVIDIDSHLTAVECPYSPPPQKVRKPTKKQNAPGKAKIPPPVLRKHRIPKDKPSSAPKATETRRKKPQPAPENLRRTRSSNLLQKPDSFESDGNRDTASQGSISDVQPGMILRRKPSRRTSYFFQPKTQATKQATRKRTSIRRKRFQIVGTFLHRDEMEMVWKAAKKLGGSIENKVSASTTHVVCGGPKRTINVLRGISRGCWLIKIEWVIQSMEKGQWIDEEPFELTNFSPAVQKCRIARETLGIYPTIFKNVGSIYVGPQTAPPKAELCELLKLCGGKIVSTTNRASVSVGLFVPGRMCVKELWVLDSIQENILLPLQRYSLPSNE